MQVNGPLLVHLTIQGLLLEPIGPLSQLLEAVNDPDPQVSMDQIGEPVKMAITLLANTSNKLSLMRRARVLDEYNKELVTFAAEKERNWAAAAPQLFGPNFLKEAADHLQTLQMVRKVKQQSQPPRQNFRQPPSQGHQGGVGGIIAMEANTILPLKQPKDLSFGEESSPEEEMTSTNRYDQYCFNANTYCESCVGESSGYGVHPTTKGRHAFEGSRQASPLCRHLEGVDKGQLGITDYQRFSDTLCRTTYTGKEAKSAFLSHRVVSSVTRGSLLPSGERSSDYSRQSLPSSKVLLCPLPGPQEEQANEASDQPQSPQSMGR